MSDKILAIISTAEAGKARTGVLYAYNAVKHGWMKDVKLVFFGPAEKLLTHDSELQKLVMDYQNLNQSAIACKFVADQDNTSQELAELGVKVQFVGEMMSGLIKDGYVPMIW
jgi:hypothetical protein